MFQGLQCLLKGQEVQEEFCLHCFMLHDAGNRHEELLTSDSGTCQTAVTAFICKIVTASSSTPALCSKFQK